MLHFFWIDYLNSHHSSNLQCSIGATGAERIQNRDHFTTVIINIPIVKIAKVVMGWLSLFLQYLLSQTKSISAGSLKQSRRFLKWWCRIYETLDKGLCQKCRKNAKRYFIQALFETWIFAGVGRSVGFVCMVQVVAFVTGVYELRTKPAIVHT